MAAVTDGVKPDPDTFTAAVSGRPELGFTVSDSPTAPAVAAGPTVSTEATSTPAATRPRHPADTSKALATTGGLSIG